MVRPWFWLAAFTVQRMLKLTACRRGARQPFITKSKVPCPRRSTRQVLWSSRGPSTLRLTRKLCFEEGAPIIVKQQAVGLEGVLHALTRLAILFDKLNSMLEEFVLHQRWLPALPRHGYLGTRCDSNNYRI
jgi:hypothetical protein